ncbi:hypothetical protein [Ktedonobacter racemifer]|nr:hypothetical protein [Ktedonobacter racemifer]
MVVRFPTNGGGGRVTRTCTARGTSLPTEANMSGKRRGRERPSSTL